MRSDFERVLKVFDEFSYGNPANTIIDFGELYFRLTEIIVGDPLETLAAMKLSDLIVYIDIPDYEGGGKYCQLTEKGIDDLKSLYRIPKGISNISEDIDAIKILITTNTERINSIVQSSYLDTLNEIQICYVNKCYNATIAMCGKLLETFLIHLLTENNIKLEVTHYDRNGKPVSTRNELTLKELIDFTNKLPPPQKPIFIDIDLLNLIRRFRNGIIHSSNEQEKPNERHLMLIIEFCLYTIKKYLTKFT